jgi:ATP-binding cassette subfamily B protein RtxE
MNLFSVAIDLIELIPYKVSVNNAVLSAFASKDCSLRLRTTGPTISITEVLEGNLTIGAFIAFRMYSNYVVEPVIRLAQIWQDFQYTLVSIKKISLILKEPLEELPKNMFLNKVSGSIIFKGVYFTYQKELPAVLSDINLTLEPGRMLGITGPSGSGKSTLTKLLQMFYQSTTGEILIDGLDIRTLSNQCILKILPYLC